MEAGLEHLGRSTSRPSDVMLIVAEPYYKSLETAARICAMAAEFNIPQIFLVANKVRTPADRQIIETFCEKHDLPVIAVVPYDEAITQAAQIPQAPMDYSLASEAVAALAGLAEKLAAETTTAEKPL